MLMAGEKFSLSDDQRKGMQAWNALQNYLKQPDLFTRPELLAEAKLLWAHVNVVIKQEPDGELSKMVNGPRVKSLGDTDLAKSPPSQEITDTDRLYCLRIATASTHDEVTELTQQWAEFKYGKRASTFTYGKDYYLKGDFLSAMGLDKMYGSIVVGEEAADRLSEIAGIARFLRYPPEALKLTDDFFQGALSSGRILYHLSSEIDHNGAMYGNYIDFKDALSKGVKTIVMEFNDEESMLQSISMFATQYRVKKAALALDTAIFSAHGNVGSLKAGLTNSDRDNVTPADRQLFQKMQEACKDMKFSQLFVFVCSAGKETPGFIPIAKYFQGIASNRLYAPDRDSNQHFGIGFDGQIHAYMDQRHPMPLLTPDIPPELLDTTPRFVNENRRTPRG